ncbi:MAG: DUF488 domain-containing protein [Rhodoferax sp.]|jgi:uncharacterized protein (DUF488 family)|nr:DUF488 domain-containing protein [Rhodoferax sp.]
MIYTIGHGNKELQYFFNELGSFNVEYLIDVRTSPYSRYNPQFNRELMKDALGTVNIAYIYMGDKLGGLPSDRSCYLEGKVSYELIKDKDFFKEGLARLIKAYEKDINVAIMCSETKPEECHRSKLIGQELFKRNIVIQHIAEQSKIKDQLTVMSELTKGQGVVDLFGNETTFTSRKKYK